MGKRLVACTGAVLAAAVAPQASAADKRGCFPRGAQTVVANAQVRVYWRDDAADPDLAHYYGCVLRTGRRTRISHSYGSQYESAGPRFFRLSRALVGFAFVRCGFDGVCEYKLSTVALSTGQRLRAYDGAEGGRQTCTVPVGLAMGASGSLVAMERESAAGNCGGEAVYSVIKVERGGASALDSAADIDPRSLALGSGGWAYWMRGGAPHAARIR